MKNQDSRLGKIRIRLDPDLQDLIPGYLENRGKDLLTYQEALEKNDFDLIAVLGHSMKGSGGGYGFNELSTIGRAIENAAKIRDKEAVRQSITEMAAFLENVEVFYD